MKVFNLIVTIALLFCSTLASADSSISEIRKEYQSIRSSLPKLTIKSVELSNYSTEGGIAKAYRDTKGNIRLIKVELYGESGKEFEEYYYRNGLLIFAYIEHYRYNMPFNVTGKVAKEIRSAPFDPKKTKIIEDRYYFDNGKMIQWLNEKKKEVSIKSKEFRDAEKQVIDFSNEIRSKFLK